MRAFVVLRLVKTKAKRLACENVFEMIYFVSSGTWNHHSVSEWWVGRSYSKLEWMGLDPRVCQRILCDICDCRRHSFWRWMMSHICWTRYVDRPSITHSWDMHTVLNTDLLAAVMTAFSKNSICFKFVNYCKNCRLGLWLSLFVNKHIQTLVYVSCMLWDLVPGTEAL